jgi:hypothetical protein
MGLWPALWLTSTTGTWPDSGEIDVIEGVHETAMNAMSSHTSHGCVQQTNGFSGEFMMNTWDKNVCAAHETNNQGCGVRPSSLSLASLRVVANLVIIVCLHYIRFEIPIKHHLEERSTPNEEEFTQ